MTRDVRGVVEANPGIIRVNGCSGDVFDKRECIARRLDFRDADIKHGPDCMLRDTAEEATS